MHKFTFTKFSLSLVLVVSCLFSASAQDLDHRLGEIMFSLAAAETPASLDRSIHLYAKDIQVTYEQVAKTPFNVWLMRFDHNSFNEIELLAYVEDLEMIHHAQFNHIVKLRQEPNDAQFDSQWQYINTGVNTGLAGADMDMDLAWDITTGGLTAQGDTIVVCVIDDGIDLEHEDLKENLWINYAEIPDNDIDDDNNGYVDDYYGWNTKVNNGNVQEDDHGTSVSGIIGAKGNNSIGVAGVNWDVKIMTVNAIPSAEDGVVAAYSYAWTQRKRYNDSNGSEGAFVVATNSSFGLSIPAEEAPLWCDFYNELGDIGIINVGATSNSGVDVDITGDVPSNCSSDYLIVATNLLWDDVKRNAAGFGAESVDLGAYGQNVFTTFRGNTYSSAFGGTSAATPHVTGVAALLYAIDCDALITEAKTNPSGAALAVKNYILNGVVPNESLEGITVTEGKLNALNTLQLGVNACSGDCPPPIAFTADVNSPFSFVLNWTAIEDANTYDIRYRIEGTNSWTEVNDVVSPFTLSNLSSCSPYEVQLRSNCNGNMSEYGFVQKVLTTGCCELPDMFTATAEGSDLVFSWTEDEFTTEYLLEYRQLGDTEWIDINISENEYTLSDLPLCKTYEARLTSLCGNFNSQSESSEILLATSECGSCTGDGYCDFTDGPDNGSEWIDSVAIGDIQFSSGQDTDGYGNNLGGATTTLLRGSLVPITLTPGFTSTQYDEYFTIWIDWNNDELFDEESELAFDPGMTTDETINGTIFIPETANLGNTRMRVIMSFESKQGPCDPGMPFRFGEVEDYCVDITNTNSTNDLLNDLEISILNNPVKDKVSFEIISESLLDFKASIYTTDGKLIHQQEWNASVGRNIHSLDTSHMVSGLYIVNITDGKRSSSFKVVKL